MPMSRRFAGLHRPTVNRLALRFGVGRAAFADLEHVGRVSGTVRHTPLRAFAVGDTVVVGVNFGRESDWLRNVRAADTCRMRLAGEILNLGRPEIVPAEQGLVGVPRVFRFALRHVVHTRECAVFPVLAREASSRISD